MDLETYFRTIHDPAVDYLATVVGKIEDNFSKPETILVSGIRQWRYPHLQIDGEWGR